MEKSLDPKENWSATHFLVSTHKLRTTYLKYR